MSAAEDIVRHYDAVALRYDEILGMLVEAMEADLGKALAAVDAADAELHLIDPNAVADPRDQELCLSAAQVCAQRQARVRERLEHCRSELLEQMRKQQKATGALRAYGMRPGSGPRFHDKRS